MRTYWILALQLVLGLAGVSLSAGSAFADEVESGVNRRGSDYNNFEMVPTIAGFGPCQAACESDTNCKAWTFVKSSAQSPRAHCWLKNSVLNATKDNCCTSGLPVRAHGCEIGGEVRMDIFDRDCQEAQSTGCVQRLLDDAGYRACLRAQPVVSGGCLAGGVSRRDIADRDCQEAQTTGCVRRLLTKIEYLQCLRAQKTAKSGGSGTPTTSGGGCSGLGGDELAICTKHNSDRAAHGVPPLTWDTSLAQNAKQWVSACHTSTDNNGNTFFCHQSPTNGCGTDQSYKFGENLSFGVPSRSGLEAVDGWYCEGDNNNYNYDNPVFHGGTMHGCNDNPDHVNGHFTQVVWIATTRIGCARNTCTLNGQTGTLWTCEYDPPGNFHINQSLEDAMRANVPRPIVQGLVKGATNGTSNSKAPANSMVSVRKDVDVYAAPGGAGKAVGNLARNSSVALIEKRSDQWCHVSGTSVPKGNGWV